MALTADDRLQIIAMLATNNQTMDQRDANGWAATFIEDGVYRTADGEELRGRHALVNLIEEMGPDSLARHWAGNFIFETTGDDVTVLSDTATLRGNKVLATGRSINRVTQVDNQWQLKHQESLNLSQCQ